VSKSGAERRQKDVSPGYCGILNESGPQEADGLLKCFPSPALRQQIIANSRCFRLAKIGFFRFDILIQILSIIADVSKL